jgi:hypothetical protein
LDLDVVLDFVFVFVLVLDLDLDLVLDREPSARPERDSGHLRRRARVPAVPPDDDDGAVEPIFGQMKEARGFRRFSFRGIARVPHEWALVCTAHNLLKLARVAKIRSRSRSRSRSTSRSTSKFSPRPRPGESANVTRRRVRPPL